MSDPQTKGLIGECRRIEDALRADRQATLRAFEVHAWELWHGKRYRGYFEGF